MSIEKTIEELTTAIKQLAENIKENTVAATTCCAKAEPAPAAKTPKPKKEKAPAPDPEPEPVEETTVEPVEEFSRDAVLTKITEFVRTKIMDAGSNDQEVKAKFMALRESYGVEKASDLPDDKLPEFYDKTVETLS